jgi:hypothetical protein
MHWHWTLPWEEVESLLGILVAQTVEIEIFDEEEKGVRYSASLISIGFLIGRVDIVYNYEKIEE